MTTPTENEIGIEIAGALVPISAPCAYVPQKGDLGVVLKNAFHPLEPYSGALPVAGGDRAFPFIAGEVDNTFAYPNGIPVYKTTISDAAQLYISVVRPDVFPYDRRNNRVRILDTPPDASASTEDKEDPNYKANSGIQILSETHKDFLQLAQVFTASNDSGDLLLTHATDLADLAKIRVSSDDVLPTGLTVDTDYWLIRISKTTTKIAISLANAIADTAIVYTDAGTGEHTITPDSAYAYDDTTGVAYLWRYRPVIGEMRIVQVDRWHVRVFLRSTNLTDTILYGAATQTTPYPSNGVLLTATQFTFSFKFSSLPFAFNAAVYFRTNATWHPDPCVGHAPPSTVRYFVETLSPPTVPEWPHPALRAGQTKYSFATPASKIGTDYDGTPFVPGDHVVSGLLMTQAYKRGMELAYWVAPADLTSIWQGKGIPVITKIGKATAAWTAGTTSLALTSPTSDAIFRYNKTSDPVISSQTTAYTDTSPAAYFTTGTTNPGFSDGDKILLTGNVPLPFFPSSRTAQTAEFYVRDSQVISGAYYFNLAIYVAGAAVATTEAKTGFAFWRRYSAPISIATTDTVSFYAEKGGQESSDLFTASIVYADETPPDDFVTNFWSEPYPTTFAGNTKTEMVAEFQRLPDWYVSPTGGGTGLTPDSPKKMEEICGYFDCNTSAYTWGLASGEIRIEISRSSGTSVAFSPGGDLPGTPGYTDPHVFYGVNVAPNILATWNGFSPYSTMVLSSMAEVQFQVRAADHATVLTPTFKQLIAAGAEALVATWTLSTKILSISGIPDFEGVEVLIDNESNPISLPIISYTATGGVLDIEITEATTLYIRLAYQNTRILSRTNATAITAIDPASTADFAQNITATWGSVDGSGYFDLFYKQGDIIWACEGTYDYNVLNKSYCVKTDCILRGGFNSDFTERDVANHQSVIVGRNGSSPATQNANIWQAINARWSTQAYHGLVDGFYGEWADAEIPYAANESPIMFKGAWFNDCHVVLNGAGTTTWNGSQWGHIIGAFWFTRRCTNCTVDISYAFSNDGNLGGLSAANVIVFSNPAYRGEAARNCVCNLDISLGNGTKGLDAVQDVSAATAGQSLQLRVNAMGISEDCTVNIAITIGNAGSGGDNNTTNSSNGGAGGSTTLLLAVGSDNYYSAAATGTIISNGNLTINATCGNSGDGGKGHVSAYGGNAGAINCLIGSSASDYLTTGWYHGASNLTESISVVVGNSGIDGTPNPVLPGGYIGAALYAMYLSSRKIDGNYSFTVGNSNNSNSGIIYLPRLGFMPKVTASMVVGTAGAGGTRTSYISNGLNSCFFDPADLTYIEDGTHGANALRVNGAGGSAGWYSGTPNGDGVPLDGYEIKQGTGIVRGRYWE